MPPRSRPQRSAVSVMTACLALSLAGCSSDDIQLNGGIFDAVGLNDTKKSGDPKLAERAPLVVPPSLDRLPAPGEAPQPAQIADIKDPDALKKLSQADLEAKQAEYCKVNYDQAMAHGDEATAANAEGPMGPCRKSVLTAIKKWNGEGQEETEGQ